MASSSPFHPGERAIQARYGLDERMAEIGQRVLRDHMPEQHQAFYAQLPLLYVGSLDARGRPWASVLAGDPGFIAVPDARTLAIGALPAADDPLSAALQAGAPLGLLGLEAATRRRNRANGRVRELGAGGFVLEVEQTTGNCPQYITRRRPESLALPPPRAEALDGLDAGALALIGAADTCFVASAAPGHGVDVSHRGGAPRFVLAEDARTLLIPDYRGNQFFMSMGNISVYPLAGLLFADLASGDLLQLSGRTELLFDGPELARLPGAERAWRLHVEAGQWLRHGLALRWEEV